MNTPSPSEFTAGHDALTSPAVFFYETPVGRLAIASDGTAITHIIYGSDKRLPDVVQETPLIAEAARQLNEYFSGVRTVFDLLLRPQGTVFQLQVWRALQTIPYGETRTYSDIARAIGNPRACRAVGQANNRNPISIVIPCHRVVRAGGALGGYAGGLAIKQHLLDLEREHRTNR